MTYRIFKIFVLVLAISATIPACKKEAEPRCQTWIVSDGWYNVSGTTLQDYNLQYGLHTGYDLAVCGAAQDTISEGKKVVLRTLHDTAFYVREYIVKRTSSK